MLDELVRLRDDVGHVRDVEVPDVGREDRVQPRSHGIGLTVERPRVDRIIGLAAEVKARHEQLLEVRLLRDLATEVVVDVLDAARHGLRLVQALAAADCRHDLILCVLAGEVQQPPAVELVRMRRLDRLAVALLPVAHEVGVEHARPPDAAFEEGEVQIGEAARHPAEEEALADGVAGRGEVADVVEAEIRRRVPQENRARTVVERRRQLELAALLPHRIVVVVAVDADDVEPLGVLRGLGLLLSDRRHRPSHQPADHDDLEAELRGRELQLFDRLLGRIHRDDRGGDDAIAIGTELIRGEHVVRPADRAAHARVLQAMVREPGGRIDDRDVDAEIVQPLVHQPREHRGRTVEHVFARRRPEALHAGAAPSTLLERHLQRVRDPRRRQGEPFDRGLTGDLAELLAHHRQVLEPVAVRVHDGMMQARVELSSCHG